MPGPSPTIVRTEVLAGSGQLWHAVYSDALVFPLDTAVGTDPGVDWEDAGPTNEGLTVTNNQEYFEKEVDQTPDTLDVIMTKRATMVTTSLAKGTLENLARALNHDIATAVTTGAGFKKFSMEVGQDAMRPLVSAILVDGWAPGDASLRRRVLVRRCVSIESVGSAYRKDSLFLIPVAFKALYVDSVTSPVDWMDEVPA